jgi:4-amino-4-deoxy-L-arabinose transferase-like glycosyltransferase
MTVMPLLPDHQLEHGRLKTVRWLFACAVFAVAMFAIGVFFWHLGTTAAADTDESTHAIVTREMRLGGDYATMHLLGKEYFRKPPFAFWLRVGAEWLFGETEFALRFFSAVAGVGTTCLLMWWMWVFTKRRIAVLAIGAVFPLLPATQIHSFRHGDTDGILIFLLTLSAYFLWRSLRKPQMILAASAALAFALMTKSAAMIVIPASFALTLLALRRWPYTLKQVLLALAIFIAIVAPWHIVETLRHGGVFWGEYLGYHIVERTTSSIVESSMNRGPFWYIKGGEKGMYPWSWLLIPAVLASFALLRKKEHRETETFLLFWGFGTVVLYSLAVTKLDWYIAPAYPAFLLLIVRLFTQPFDSVPRWLRWASLLTIGLLFIRAAYLARIGVRTAFPFVESFQLRGAVAVIAGALLAFFLVLVVVTRGRRTLFWRFALLPVFALMLVVDIQTWIDYEQVKRESPYRVFAREIDRLAPNQTVYVYDIGVVQKPEAHWYLRGEDNHRSLTPLREDEAALTGLLASEPGAFVLAMREREFPTNIRDRLSYLASATTLSLYQIVGERKTSR